jgi:hypothetical protein
MAIQSFVDQRNGEAAIYETMSLLWRRTFFESSRGVSAEAGDFTGRRYGRFGPNVECNTLHSNLEAVSRASIGRNSNV